MQRLVTCLCPWLWCMYRDFKPAYNLGGMLENARIFFGKRRVCLAILVGKKSGNCSHNGEHPGFYHLTNSKCILFSESTSWICILRSQNKNWMLIFGMWVCVPTMPEPPNPRTPHVGTPRVLPRWVSAHPWAQFDDWGYAVSVLLWGIYGFIKTNRIKITVMSDFPWTKKVRIWEDNLLFVRWACGFSDSRW